MSSDIACTMDWIATVLQLAAPGARRPRDRRRVSRPDAEGRGDLAASSDAIFAGMALAAIRKGPWKLHIVSPDTNSANPFQLFARAHTLPPAFPP